MIDTSDTVQINLLEVDDAEPLAGQLFKRSFNHQIPKLPPHYVLVASDEKGQALTLGYVHFTQHHNMYLGGGMCVDIRALRYIPKHLRTDLNNQGGVAFYMLTEAVKKLKDCDAVFGYVGHKGAYKIDLAVGFEPTIHPHLIVYWKTELTQAQRQQTIKTAYEFGPF